QLHTTGGVRFQGMTGTGNRLIQTDATGALAPISAGTAGQVLTQTATGLAWQVPSVSGWNLTGNAAVSGQFLGTTNSTPLEFKVNNVKSGFITTNNTMLGYQSGFANSTGSRNSFIGVSAGQRNTTGANNVAVGGSAGANNITGSNNTYIGTDARANTTGLDSVTLVGANSVAWAKKATALGAKTLASAESATAIGYGAVASAYLATAIGANSTANQANSLILGNVNDAALKVGIGTTAPTAKLHTVGTVRHQNLPTGSGRILVIDAAGNVFASLKTASKEPQTGSNSDVIAETIEAQATEIADLKARLERLEKLLSATNGAAITPNPTNEKVVLEQNRPNPANDVTVIGYELPENDSKMALNVTDLNGKIIFTQLLPTNQGNVELHTGSWTEGSYFYSLVSDGKVLKTKKLVVSKN
ncbi:MAG: hypothetical protein RL329_1167, partial [Bacteroidota bacterium]